MDIQEPQGVAQIADLVDQMKKELETAEHPMHRAFLIFQIEVAPSIANAIQKLSDSGTPPIAIYDNIPLWLGQTYCGLMLPQLDPAGDPLFALMEGALKYQRMVLTSYRNHQAMINERRMATNGAETRKQEG